MKTRQLLLSASATGLVITCTLGVGTVAANAATPTPPPSASTQATKVDFSPVTAEVVGLTKTSVQIRVESDDSDFTRAQLLDSDGSVVDERIMARAPGVKRAATTLKSVVRFGTLNHFSIRLRSGDELSEPVAYDVDTRITSVEAPQVLRVFPSEWDQFLFEVRAKKGARVEVRDSRGRVVATRDMGEKTTGFVAVSLRTPDGPVTPQYTVTQRYGIESAPTALSRFSQALPPEGDLEAPTVVSREVTQGQSTLVKFDAPGAPEGSWVVVRDMKRKLLAGSQIHNGRTTIEMGTPSSETQVFASVYTYPDESTGQAEFESAPTSFLLSEGVGTQVPDAPVVTDTSVSGARAVVTAKVDPGAVVTIRDKDDKLVAVRKAGATASSVQLTFPVTTRAVGEYSAYQSAGSADSPSSTFTLGN